MILFVSVLLAQLLAATPLVVAPQGPYRTIPEALAAAQAGATIEVRGGVHAGPLVIDRPVALVGVDRPVLDGGGRGTVVTLAAPGATLRGFDVRSSGRTLNTNDAGIEVRAAGVVVEDNHLEDVLFGISLDDAPGSVIRDNVVHGKSLPIAERGDGLRLWYSSDVLVQGNQVAATRDCVVWYSARVRLLGNLIEQQRYGLHFMNDDDAELADNVLRDNSVGAYMMYSTGVTLRGNLFAGNRGPSGFGLGLKDMDNVSADGNWLVDNRVGVWSDTSPRSIDAYSRFHRNMIAFNDIGLSLAPSTQRNMFSDNAFQDNLQQVSLQGGGVLRGNTWAEHGRGNYWTDYRGFDADGDGVGDVPYRAEALFADWMDRRPELRLFQFGLAADMVEFAARAFPTLRPPPRLVDDAPLTAPPPFAAPPGQPAADPRPPLGVAAGLLVLASGILGLTRLRPANAASALRVRARRDGGAANGRATSALPAPAALRVACLEVRFGRYVAVDNLSFSVAPAEIVALWGPNGAGKTSALKCILGLLPYSGEVAVVGLDALRQGKGTRRAVGYVPQDVALHDDLTVLETVAFYARLKRVPADRASGLLATLGLAEHGRKAIDGLSGGLRQRLALVLALLGDPPLLVLDEPTSNLDAAGREQVLGLLSEQRRRGTAIVFASHRVDEVEALADRVLVLTHGRLASTCAGHELASCLGLRQRLHLHLVGERRDDAVVVLRAAGLSPLECDGRFIDVDVPRMQKALPIHLLERAGIVVDDFSIVEEGATTPSSVAGPEADTCPR